MNKEGKDILQMKKTPLIAVVMLMLSFLTVQCQAKEKYTFDVSDTTLLLPNPELEKEALIINSVLSKAHYRKMPLNDSLSSVIMSNYLDALDPYKVYFLKSDINNFEKYRYELDDDIKSGNLGAAFEIYNVFRKRFNERMKVADSLTQVEFDFTKKEYYEADREKVPWPTSTKELDELWRKIIKSQALSLKLADKEWPEIKENLKKRYERQQKYMDQSKSMDVFQAYMNAYTEAFDPHTSYFSPVTSENFQISMSQSLEGIGAQLTQDGDYTKVAEVIAGGPAFKSKKIFKDDRIIGVAQGDDGEMVDVIGWRLDDVVQLIRGKKGSKVRLNLLKASEGASAVPTEIMLVRDKIKLEEQRAKGNVVPYSVNGRTFNLGVITIPSFYMDFEAAQKGDPNYSSTTRDVKNLITDLQKKGIDGLVIDLTYNGGGSLTEAIQLTGLFIPEGPVVQVKNADGSINSGDDPDASVFYNGPLAVVTNRFSASASEIFAGAIQDYQRGLIIGEQTFGKGTVQNLIDLDQIARSKDAKLGQLKLTLAKFYRVTGSSTQHKGVIPDIELPSEFGAKEFGESSRPSALPWDQIRSARFKKMNTISDKKIAQLRQKYQERLKTDQELIALVDDIKELKKARENTKISLNLEERKKEIEEMEKRKKERELLQGQINLEIHNPEAEKVLKEKDPYVRESVRILAELIAS